MCKLLITHGADTVCICLWLALFKVDTNTIANGKLNRSTGCLTLVKANTIFAVFHNYSPFGGSGSGIQ